MKPLAKDVMTHPVVTLRRGMFLRQAMEIFKAERITGAPVVDESGRPVGVLSIADILRFQAGREKRLDRRLPAYYTVTDYEGAASWTDFEGVSPESLDMVTVNGVMTLGAITVSPETPIGVIARLMACKHIHRIIVTRKDLVVGVVSSLDLVRLLAKSNGGPELV